MSSSSVSGSIHADSMAFDPTSANPANYGTIVLLGQTTSQNANRDRWQTDYRTEG
jgi:hypothetical protein